MLRNIMGALALSAAVLPGLSAFVAPAAADDPVVMNVGWATPLDSNYGILGAEFERLVEEYTGGSIDVRLRCCSQIGTEDDAFRALQLGTIDAYIITQNNVSPHWPLMDVFVLPYIFQDTDHLLAVSNGPVGAMIRDTIQADTGVHLLTFGGPSYRDMFNSHHAVNTIEDLDGLKMRVPRNEVMLATFEAFGAEPVPLAWSETPTALQTGTIDGGDNGTSVIRDMRFYEYAEHLTILDHFTSVSPLFASERFMGNLSEDQREAVLRAALDAGAHHAEVIVHEAEDLRTWLAGEGGMSVTRPERGPFIAAAQTVQQQFAAERGEAFQALVDQIQAAAE